MEASWHYHHILLHHNRRHSSTPAVVGTGIAAADIDGDGDLDIFIGGRVALGTYPEPPRSYILRNDHGKFVDITTAVCPALENPGLINAAVWTDIDNDKKPDLIIAADWMPIRIFKNNGATLTEITEQSGLKDLPGFWRSSALQNDFRKVAERFQTPAATTGAEPSEVSTVQQWPWYHSKNAYKEIMDEVNNDRLYPIETVGLTQHAGFKASIAEGIGKLENKNNLEVFTFEGMIDVVQARNSLITPIPRR